MERIDIQKKCAPRRVQIGLGIKFVLLTIGILSTTLGLSTAFILRSQNKLYYEHLKEIGEIQGTFISLITPENISLYDLATLDEYVMAMSSQKDVVYSVVFDDRGNPMSSYLDPEDPFIMDAARQVESMDITQLISKIKRQNDIYHMQFPIVYELEKLGNISIGISNKNQKLQARKALFTHLMGNIAIIIFLCACIYIVFRHSALRPIKDLVQGSERISNGKLDKPVKIFSNDELGRLTGTFNYMMEMISQDRHELKQHKEHLEEIVKERTSALESTNASLKNEIAEREQTEAELKIFTAKLKQSNRELDDFAYVASHDLQEPLRKVMAFGDRLKDKFSDTLHEQGRDYIERMQNASRRMQTLINDLLTYSRVTTKAQAFVTVDLGTVAREVESDLEIRIEQTGGRVDIGELPTIDADPLQMRQLLQNLMGNALKFHRREEPPVVKIRGKILYGQDDHSAGNAPVGALCQITVEDNGIGFDEKYADRIFVVFQRLNDKQEFEGTGVGLAVCRKIVERHGGSITAESTPGNGATFTMIFPARQPAGNKNG